MMRKLFHKFSQKPPAADVEPLLARLEKIRETHGVLALYGSPTQGNWLGIANATQAIYPGHALEVPQWFSHPRLTPQQQNRLTQKIIALHFKAVIISGFADYFFGFADALHPHTEVHALFHGTFSECHSPAMQAMWQKLLRYTQTPKIRRLGFVRTGLDTTFSALYGIDCYHQPIPTVLGHFIKTPLGLDGSHIHIGVFGADTFNKNLHNQVLGALSVPGTVVHVQDDGPFAYLGMGARIQAHGKALSRNEFLNLLANMHLNLYLSFSESWGLVAAESVALGVPCLVSAGSSLQHPLLYRLAETDSPEKIREAIQQLLSQTQS